MQTQMNSYQKEFLAKATQLAAQGKPVAVHYFPIRPSTVRRILQQEAERRKDNLKGARR